MKSSFKEDFSARPQYHEAPAPVKTITPAIPPPPVVLPSKKPYVPLPLYKVADTPILPPMRVTGPPAPYIAQTPIQLPYSSFSPSLETFPTLNNSYFITDAEIQADVSRWASYPAVTDVNANGNRFLGSVVGPTGTFDNVVSPNINSTSGKITLNTQILETIGSDLFFDGQLLAKANDIQNISDWADYPAIKSVNMNDFSLDNVTQITDVNLDFGTAGQVLGSDGSKIKWVPAGAGPTGPTGPAGATGSSADASTWSNYPASSGLVRSNESNLSVTADRLLSSAVPSVLTLNTSGGLYGEVDVTANGGAGGGLVKINGNGAGAYGRVSINASYGTSGSVTTGGLVDITATSGFNDVSLTSAIKLSAAGINSYAGAIPSVGSLAGYNFIYGTAGVNICAGASSVIPNIPLTTYLYGLNGIVLGSDVYTTQIYPYWDALTPSASNLKIRGRSTPSTTYVELQDVTTLKMSGSGAISGVSTINGSSYPPPAGVGPTGPAGPTGATGPGFSFVGATGSVLYYDGAGVTGNTGFTYDGISKLIGTNGNYLDLDELTDMRLNPAGGNVRAPNFVPEDSLDLSQGIGGPASIYDQSGNVGATGQYLTSSGSGGGVLWTSPPLPYSLAGTQAGAVIVNRGIGAINALTQNIYNLISTITFNLPAVLNSTDGIYYDGYNFCDFQANFNSFWGVSYITNTYAIPTDILGSTTTTANSLNFSNFQQVYLPTNLLIPPTHLVGGGTITLFIYCNPTSTNHYLTIAPTNSARIGIVQD